MSAQIMTHARFATQPVKQQPRRGRLPKAVPSVLIYGRDKTLKAYRDSAIDARVNELRKLISDEERFFAHLRYELAVTLQQPKVGRA